jgi:hypothetical protein
VKDQANQKKKKNKERHQSRTTVISLKNNNITKEKTK